MSGIFPEIDEKSRPHCADLVYEICRMEGACRYLPSCNCNKDVDRFVLKPSFCVAAALFWRRLSTDWRTRYSLSFLSFLLSSLLVIVLDLMHFCASRARALGCLLLVSFLSVTCLGRNDWDCHFFYATFLFFRYQGFLLLTIQNVCDHCFHLRVTFWLVSVNLIRMVWGKSMLHDGRLCRMPTSKTVSQRPQQVRLPSLSMSCAKPGSTSPSCRCATECSASRSCQ